MCRAKTCRTREEEATHEPTRTEEQDQNEPNRSHGQATTDRKTATVTETEHPVTIHVTTKTNGSFSKDRGTERLTA